MSIKRCTNKELTYLQWYNQTLVKNGSPLLKFETDESYSRYYPYNSYSHMLYPPEMSYFMDKAGLTLNEAITMDDFYDFMSETRFYDQAIVSEIFLNKGHPEDTVYQKFISQEM